MNTVFTIYLLVKQAVELPLGEKYNIPADVSADQKAIADDFKNRGNEFMRDDKFHDAMIAYTRFEYVNLM